MAVVLPDGEGHRPSHPLNDGPLEGTLVLAAPLHVQRAQVLVGTHGVPSADSGLRLELFRGEESLTSARTPEQTLHDNSHAQLEFDPPVRLEPGSYRYVITLQQPELETRVSVWRFTDSGGVTHRVGKKKFSGAPKVRFVGARPPGAEEPGAPSPLEGKAAWRTAYRALRAQVVGAADGMLPRVLPPEEPRRIYAPAAAVVVAVRLD